MPCACRFYSTTNQTPIRTVSASQIRRWIGEGHFAPGSMLPKMEAAAQFVSSAGRQAIVTNPASLTEALRGAAGTIVQFSPQES